MGDTSERPAVGRASRLRQNREKNFWNLIAWTKLFRDILRTKKLGKLLLFFQDAHLTVSDASGVVEWKAFSTTS